MLLAGLCLGGATQAAGPADLGRARGYLTDAAGALPPAAGQRIEAYLARVDAELQVQIAVAVVPTTAPLAIEDYAVQLFKLWGVGGEKKDEGLLLLVAVQDRAVKFETGYGLEGTLPDGRLGGIIREQILPRFRAGDFENGILAGVVAAANAVAAERGVPAPRLDGATIPRRASRPQGLRANGLLGLVLLIFFVSLVSSSRSRRGGRRGGPGSGSWGGPWYGGGSFGSGGFGGGGFGGGFGGFGGGASGGGGATGKW